MVKRRKSHKKTKSHKKMYTIWQARLGPKRKAKSQSKWTKKMVKMA